MPDELWTEVHDIVQETGIKTIPKKKKCTKAKWLPEEALQIAVKRREVKINKDLQTLKQSFIFTHIKSLIMKRDRNLDIKNKKNY